MESITQTQTISVVFEDGRRVTVALRLADTIAYSMVWRKRQWPSPEEDKMMVGAYSAFAACRRLGHFSGNFESFTEAAVTLELADDDQDDEDTERPTSAGTEPVPATQAPTPAPAPVVDGAPAAQAPIADTATVQTAPTPTL